MCANECGLFNVLQCVFCELFYVFGGVLGCDDRVLWVLLWG